MRPLDSKSLSFDTKKQFYYKRWFLFLLRLSLSVTFIYAGAIKLRAPLAFADTIASFEVLPPNLISITALTLPPFEMIIGGSLLIRKFRLQAAFSVFALTVVFALTLGQALIRGLQVDCGCFGSSEHEAWITWISLGRDLLMMAASGWLYCVFGKPVPTLLEQHFEKRFR